MCLPKRLMLCLRYRGDLGNVGNCSHGHVGRRTAGLPSRRRNIQYVYLGMSSLLKEWKLKISCTHSVDCLPHANCMLAGCRYIREVSHSNRLGRCFCQAFIRLRVEEYEINLSLGNGCCLLYTLNSVVYHTGGNWVSIADGGLDWG